MVLPYGHDNKREKTHALRPVWQKLPKTINEGFKKIMTTVFFYNVYYLVIITDNYHEFSVYQTN